MAKIEYRDGKVWVSGVSSREEAYRALVKDRETKPSGTDPANYQPVAEELKSWGQNAASQLNLIQARAGSWFDRREYSTKLTTLKKLRSEADEWRKTYRDNPYASTYLRQMTNAIDAAGNSWDDISRYYAQWEDAEGYARYQTLDGADLDAWQRELDGLDQELESARQRVHDTRMQHRYSAAHPIIQEYDRLQKLRSGKNADLTLARRMREQKTLSSVGDPGSGNFVPDIQQKGAYQEGTGDLTYEYINGKDNGKRQELDRSHQKEASLRYLAGAVQGMDNPYLGAVESPYRARGYDLMTEEETTIYNYYYHQEGRQKAEEYLQSIQETLNWRKASGAFAQMEDSRALEMLFGFSAGLDQWKSGAMALGDRKSDYIEPSVMQMASSMVREDLADWGPKLPQWMGGGSLGQGAYDLITTTANMAPSILSSAAANLVLPGSGAAVGSAMMFAGAAGNAYQEALNLGYDKGQARAYSALIGGSEAGLQALIGGISALGGTGKMVSKVLDGIDNGVFRVAGRIGASALSEGLEEGLQEVLTPVFQNLALHLDEDINWSEAAYSAILGAVTGLLLEGPGIYGEGRAVKKTGQQVMGTEGYLERLRELGSLQSADSAAYQLAGRVDENTDAYTIGRLFNEIGAEITQQNMADIQKSLERKGFTERQAQASAEAFARVVMGDTTLSERQIAAIAVNDRLSKTVMDVIINPHSTVSQRTKGYSDMLRELANEQAGVNAYQAAPASGITESGGQNAASGASVTTRETKTQKAATHTTEASRAAETAQEAQSLGAVTLRETGEQVGITEIQSIENGKITLSLEDGTTVTQEEADLSGNGAAPVWEAAAQMGVSREEGAVLLADWQQGTALSPEEYAFQMKAAARFAGMGIPMEQAAVSGATKGLTDLQLRHIYDMAGKQAEAKAQKEQAALAGRTGPKTAKPGENLHLEGIVWTDLSEDQQMNLSASQVYTDILGLDLYVHASQTDSEGNHIGDNGWYDPKDGSIHIDLYAGRDGRGVMMYTLAHELTHYIKDWSPVKFKALADFLFQEYAGHNKRADLLIEAKLDTVRKRYSDRNLTEAQLYDIAYEEVVADSMEAMLTDGRVLKKLKVKENSIWQQLKDYIHEIAEKIRGLYARLKPDSAEANMVLEMKDSIEKIQELFAEGLNDAAANRAAAQKNTAREGGVAASVRWQIRHKTYSDQELSENTRALADMTSVYTVPAERLKRTGKAPSSIFDDYFAKWGNNISSAEFGDISLPKSSVKSEIRHGITAEKIASIEAIPSVITSGKVIFAQKKPGRDVERIVVCAPIEIGTVSYYMGVMLQRDSRYQRLYLHNVVLEKEMSGTSEANLVTTGAAENNEHLFMTNILQNALEVKRMMATKKEIDLPHDRGQQLLDNLPNYGYPSTSDKNVTQDKPKSQEKIGGAGASVRYSSRGYSYDSLVSKPDMTVTKITGKIPSNRADAVYAGKQNAAKIGKFDTRTGNVTVPVKDIGRDVVVSTGGLRHSLDRIMDVNAQVITKAGEILANSIRINEMNPENPNAKESYILLGAARNVRGDFLVVRSVVNQFSSDLKSMDVLYAMNAKAEPKNAQKKNRPGAYPQGFADIASDSLSGSEMSIADLLDYVNRYFPDILPEEVLKHYGHDRRPEGDLGRSVLYQPRGGDFVQEKLGALDERVRTELKEDFDQTKAVFRILDVSEKSGIFTEGSLKAAARNLIRLAGAKNKVSELTALLKEVYSGLAQQEKLTWEQAEEGFSRVVDWLMENRKKELDGYAMEVLRTLRGTTVALDEEQKGNAAYQYGSYNEYRKRMLGTVTLTDKGTPLDSMWQEWSGAYPDVFDPDTNATDMPGALEEAAERLRNMTADQTMGIDTAQLRQSLLMETYEGLIRAAVYPAEGETMLPWRDQRIAEMQREHDQQIKTLMEKHEGQMTRLRQRQEAQINTIRDNNRYAQERRKYSREKTEIRHRIVRTVARLNSMLLNETKNRHIPEILKMAVIEALEAVNMDTVSAQKRIEALRQELAETSDRDKAEELQERIRTLEEMGGRMDRKLERLNQAYSQIKAEKDPALSYAFDEEVLAQIQLVQSEVGKTALRDMTKAQLELVDELYTMVATRIRTMNEAFATERKETITGMGERAVREILKAGGTVLKRLPVMNLLNHFAWNNEKPVFAFRRIGSDTLTELYQNVRKGEDVWAVDMAEGRAFAQNAARACNLKRWDQEETHQFTSTNGHTFRLNLGQIMTLYAYSKRKQAWDHLEKGGFTFPAGTKVKEKKGGVEVTYELTSAQTYKVDRALLEEISGVLSAEQKAFVDRMQDYLSRTMGAKGNEVSLKLYGIKLYKEKYYFPIKISKAYLDQEAQTANVEIKVKSKGFTKQTQEKAPNPMELHGFMDLWADHVNEMSMYHGFALPLEDLYRVRNYRDPMAGAPGEGEQAPDNRSVTGALLNAYGKGASDYMEQLLKDLNGGAMGDPREGFAKAMVSRHKKSAVLGSLSVIIQQPSAVFRAGALVDLRYFGLDSTLIKPLARTVFRPKKHQQQWDEVKKYAPVALVKEIGGFDTSMGMSAREYLTNLSPETPWEKIKAAASLKDSSYRDELLGRMASLMDEMAWVSIWKAVKLETKAKNQSMDVKSEAFLQKAGERFTEVITMTQVYDSVLSRSSNMRSKGVFMNMATSFMAEPTTTINLLEDGLRQWKRGDKKYCARVLGAVLASNTINAALASLVYAMRDDDEEETFAEKYVSRFASEMVESANPLTYLPFVKDIVSVTQGFDVERSDMSLISDLASAGEKLQKLLNEDTEEMDEKELREHEKELQEALWGLSDVLGSLTGFPARNLRRDAKAVGNLFRTLGRGQTTTKGSLMDAIEEGLGRILDGGTGDKLYDAIMAGDSVYISRLKAGYSSEASYRTAVRKALRLNDERIALAAKARYSGDLESYSKYVSAITREGRFSKNDVISAVETAEGKLHETESTPKAEKAKSLYNADNFKTAIVKGKTALADSIRKEITETGQANGKTGEEAEKAFLQTARSAIAQGYLEEGMSRDSARKALERYGGMDAEEAAAKITEWDFEKKHGFSFGDRKDAYLEGKISREDMLEALAAAGRTEEEAEDQLMVWDWQKEEPEHEDISAPAIENYSAFCEAAGISKGQYYEVWKGINALESDYDSQGNAIKNSKTQKVMAYIHTLPLTQSQKTALALCQYKASTVQKYRLW